MGEPVTALLKLRIWRLRGAPVIAVGLVGSLLSVAPASATLQPAAAQGSGGGPVTIAVSASPNPVATGQAMAYTITASNTGGSDASGLTLTDTVTNLGTGGVATTPLMTASAGSCSYDATASQVTCTAASLPAGRRGRCRSPGR